ncbi:hypothetical protein BASA50_004131 [Batrachochytrium salamandrivorans]|uniref:2-dehydropantoate 2-reductase n=1 Tax=Batrachochytrium salamandrivorans TaxID=1357716 RepID=A0ABQ8FGN3_9FUNG|nr:hypothetical protein BASA60_007739 [Batrachochytrium salamandrivorans]KAH6597627.1 hypothetical protein BASA61_003080 [Batrachochytrium salamandrivorans]KAH6597977.1 hypothetical protein BASA50_004131 [Batrachochytrium salamandrivorans]KAH9269986.1 hypothetical protein BASA83_007974 [Batrachochytrium salamandrivorans]
MSTHVLIVGAGAVGAFYGSRLHSAHGISTPQTLVSVVCRSNYNVVKAKGFRIESPKFGSTVWTPHRVFQTCMEAARSGIGFDYIIVATKSLPELHDGSIDIEPVIAASHHRGSSLEHHQSSTDTGYESPLSPSPTIVLIQNGFGIEWPYRTRFPHSPILSCVAIVSCQQPDPGLILHNRWTRISIGPFFNRILAVGDSGLDSVPKTHANVQEVMAKMNTFIALLKAGGVSDAEPLDEVGIQIARWHKLAVNSTFNPSSILGGGVGSWDLLSDPVVEEHARGCMKEIFDAAPVLFGAPFPAHFATIDAILKSTKRNKGSKPSMLADWEAGRPLELQVILGNPLLLARQHGVEMPRLQTVYALIKSAAERRAINKSKL